MRDEQIDRLLRPERLAAWLYRLTPEGRRILAEQRETWKPGQSEAVGTAILQLAAELPLVDH